MVSVSSLSFLLLKKRLSESQRIDRFVAQIAILSIAMDLSIVLYVGYPYTELVFAFNSFESIIFGMFFLDLADLYRF